MVSTPNSAAETYRYVATRDLDIAYLEYGRAGASNPVAILSHGWPDSPQGWRRVASGLVDAGYRVLCPALRGFAPSRFRADAVSRSGQLSALGLDLLGFIEALHLDAPLLVGHDWGARACANAVGLKADAGSAMVMISVGYGTNHPDQTLPYAQAQQYWYQWFLATWKGEQALRDDRRAFARRMWDTWAPPGWYREAEFDEAAAAFDGPDWVDVVLQSYRYRWGFCDGDPALAKEEAALNPAPQVHVPTLMLHGAEDSCSAPAMSEGKEKFFDGRYERQVIPGAGHFPQRERPDDVTQAILSFCA